MMWLVTRVVVWPYKVLAGTTKATARTTAGGFKAGYNVGRVVGYRRLTVLGIGVGIGLLVAPVPGRELRARLRDRLEDLRALGGFGADGGREDGEDVDRWAPVPPAVTPAPASSADAPALPATETTAVPAADVDDDATGTSMPSVDAVPGAPESAPPPQADDDVMREITGTGPAT